MSAPRPPDDLAARLGGAIPGASAVAEVTRRLLDFLLSDAVGAGDRLPPERQLAATMGVGRSAVREALAALEVLGVVSVRPGSGTYLRGSASELLPRTLSWGVLLHGDQTRELFEVRHGLEVQAARQAATFVSDEALRALADHLETMRRSTGDPGAFAAAEALFHEELAAAADNGVIRDLLASIRSLVHVPAGTAPGDDAPLTVDGHAAVLAALEIRDPEAAAAAMHRHMTRAGARLRASLPAA